MWRRLLYNSQLRTLRSRRSASTVNRFASADVSYSPPPSRRSLAPISRHFSSDSAAESVGSKKRVEDVMPIATGHEREELEAELEGRKLLDVNYPAGPFGTKESPAVIKSYYDKRIVGCPTQIVKFSFRSPISTSQWRRGGGRGLVPCPHATVSRQAHGTFDPDIRSVLELATDSELYELENILFGSSYFSPLLKSVTKRADVDYFMIEEDPHERDNFIAIIESRFLFLAADARSTLRGWRPSYRDVLLQVREKLKIPCSRKLSTEDLESEIFLHLMQEYSRLWKPAPEVPIIGVNNHKARLMKSTIRTTNSYNSLTPFAICHESNTFQTGSLELGLSQWKVQAIAGLKIGASEIRKMILKGGGMLTLGKLYQLLANKLLGRMFLEAANYQIKNEVIKKGGQLAAVSLESRVALLAAKQGIAGAAARYLGLRSMMTLLGPMLWGTFLADVVIQMLGTDYARILRAIFAFAQIRIARTYRLPLYIDQED